VKDSILTSNWNHNLTLDLLVNQNLLESISKFFFIDKIVDFTGLCAVLIWLNESICDHKIGSFELTELERTTDRSLFIIEV